MTAAASSSSSSSPQMQRFAEGVPASGEIRVCLQLGLGSFCHEAPALLGSRVCPDTFSHSHRAVDGGASLCPAWVCWRVPAPPVPCSRGLISTCLFIRGSRRGHAHPPTFIDPTSPTHLSLTFQAILCFAGDSDTAIVNPCYDGTHVCDTTARCQPGAGLQYSCECTAGYRGDGQDCVGECRWHCSLRPPRLGLATWVMGAILACAFPPGLRATGKAWGALFSQGN